MAFVKRLNQPVLWIVIACIATRLPQLLSEHLLLDGDECIVGLMAKHLLEGKEFPVFFYGQSYGFSLAEALPISLFYTIFGVNHWAVKIPMLLFWIGGVILFYKTLLQLQPKHKHLPLLITLALIACPAWAVWSMKARGGYLTSFFLSTLVSYMILNPKLENKFVVWFFSGILLILIYQSQPLWMPAMLPLVGHQLYQTRSLKSVGLLVSGATIALLLFYYVKLYTSGFWSPQIISFEVNLFQDFRALPDHIYQNIAGSYYLGHFIKPAPIVSVYAVSFTIGIFAALVFSVYYWIRKISHQPLVSVFALSLLFIIGYLFLMQNYAPRYLLPLSGFAFMLFFLLLNQFKSPFPGKIILAFFIAIGAASLYTFKDYKFYGYKRQHFEAMTNHLMANDLNYVFSTGGLLQWQIMFYSEEKVLGRFFSSTDRYPEYVKKVNETYEKEPDETAIVGKHYQGGILKGRERFHSVGQDFFVYPNPKRKTLKEMGFEF